MKKNIPLFFIVVTVLLLVQNLFSQPVMNEIFSRGTTGNLDWIEIYNPADTLLNLTGYKIYDIGGQSGSKPKKLFPAGAVIPAHGFYVIITDTADYPGDLSGFGLSSNGEEVWLEDSAGNVIDNVVFPAMGVTQSYGRLPDGGAWQLLNVITRGLSNMANVNLSIKLNEIFSRGTIAQPDWIEIYNTSTSSIDVSNYKIYDIGGQSGTKPKKLFPAGSIVPPNGFFVIVTDDSDTSGFGLSSSGEKVWLENDAGVVIDSVDFPALEVNQSFIRYPDGASNWLKTDSITRGTANFYLALSAVKMNEIYSRGTTTDPDWIEIYNSSSSPVDLTGYKIYDNGGQGGTKPKKQFPNGTIIPPNGFYVIVTDDADPSGFGLSSNGEEVWFEDASGTVIDNVVFPAMDLTQSYGRLPDGGTWQLLNNITKGFSNVPVGVDDDYSYVKDFILYQNYPNPFNPETIIKYQIAERSYVKLKIFDMLGREAADLVNELQDAGTYSFIFNATNLSSGIYLYSLSVNGFSLTKKLNLVK